jgi:hypothetical protein
MERLPILLYMYRYLVAYCTKGNRQSQVCKYKIQYSTWYYIPLPCLKTVCTGRGKWYMHPPPYHTALNTYYQGT